MSAVENTMKFIDHAAPASVSVGDVHIESQNGVSDELLAKISEITQAIVNRPTLKPQVIPAPTVECRPIINVEAPKVEIPEIKIPAQIAPQVFVTVSLLDKRAQVILALFLLTQIIMLGVIIWR